MRFATLILTIAILPTTALSQTVGRSVLVPPNAIDRATAESDARNSAARRAAEADRLSASATRRDAAPATGPIPQSTMTDSAEGFGVSQETGTPVTPPRL